LIPVSDAPLSDIVPQGLSNLKFVDEKLTHVYRVDRTLIRIPLGERVPHRKPSCRDQGHASRDRNHFLGPIKPRRCAEGFRIPELGCAQRIGQDRQVMPLDQVARGLDLVNPAPFARQQEHGRSVMERPAAHHGVQTRPRREPRPDQLAPVHHHRQRVLDPARIVLPPQEDLAIFRPGRQRDR